MNGHAECVKVLLAYGTDVNVKDENEETVLMTTAFYGQIECMKVLLKSGADVNMKENKGRTALMYAVIPSPSHKRAECVRALLIAGADVTAKDKDGKTALMLAANSEENAECVKMLQEAEAMK